MNCTKIKFDYAWPQRLVYKTYSLLVAALKEASSELPNPEEAIKEWLDDNKENLKLGNIQSADIMYSVFDTEGEANDEQKENAQEIVNSQNTRRETANSSDSHYNYPKANTEGSNPEESAASIRLSEVYSKIFAGQTILTEMHKQRFFHQVGKALYVYKRSTNSHTSLVETIDDLNESLRFYKINEYRKIASYLLANGDTFKNSKKPSSVLASDLFNTTTGAWNHALIEEIISKMETKLDILLKPNVDLLSPLVLALRANISDGWYSYDVNNIVPTLENNGLLHRAVSAYLNTVYFDDLIQDRFGDTIGINDSKNTKGHEADFIRTNSQGEYQRFHKYSLQLDRSTVVKSWNIGEFRDALAEATLDIHRIINLIEIRDISENTKDEVDRTKKYGHTDLATISGAWTRLKTYVQTARPTGDLGPKFTALRELFNHIDENPNKYIIEILGSLAHLPIRYETIESDGSITVREYYLNQSDFKDMISDNPTLHNDLNILFSVYNSILSLKTDSIRRAETCDLLGVSQKQLTNIAKSKNMKEDIKEVAEEIEENTNQDADLKELTAVEEAKKQQEGFYSAAKESNLSQNLFLDIVITALRTMAPANYLQTSLVNDILTTKYIPKSVRASKQKLDYMDLMDVDMRIMDPEIRRSLVTDFETNSADNQTAYRIKFTSPYEFKILIGDKTYTVNTQTTTGQNLHILSTYTDMTIYEDIDPAEHAANTELLTLIMRLGLNPKTLQENADVINLMLDLYKANPHDAQALTILSRLRLNFSARNTKEDDVAEINIGSPEGPLDRANMYKTLTHIMYLGENKMKYNELFKKDRNFYTELRTGGSTEVTRDLFNLLQFCEDVLLIHLLNDEALSVLSIAQNQSGTNVIKDMLKSAMRTAVAHKFMSDWERANSGMTFVAWASNKAKTAEGSAYSIDGLLDDKSLFQTTAEGQFPRALVPGNSWIEQYYMAYSMMYGEALKNTTKNAEGNSVANFRPESLASHTLDELAILLREHLKAQKAMQLVPVEMQGYTKTIAAGELLPVQYNIIQDVSYDTLVDIHNKKITKKFTAGELMYNGIVHNFFNSFLTADEHYQIIPTVYADKTAFVTFDCNGKVEINIPGTDTYKKLHQCSFEELEAIYGHSIGTYYTESFKNALVDWRKVFYRKFKHDGTDWSKASAATIQSKLQTYTSEKALLDDVKEYNLSLAKVKEALRLLLEDTFLGLDTLSYDSTDWRRLLYYNAQSPEQKAMIKTASDMEILEMVNRYYSIPENTAALLTKDLLESKRQEMRLKQILDITAFNNAIRKTSKDYFPANGFVDDQEVTIASNVHYRFNQGRAGLNEIGYGLANGLFDLDILKRRLQDAKIEFVKELLKAEVQFTFSDGSGRNTVFENLLASSTGWLPTINDNGTTHTMSVLEYKELWVDHDKLILAKDSKGRPVYSLDQLNAISTSYLLNPLLEKYFYIDNILSANIKYSLLGNECSEPMKKLRNKNFWRDDFDATLNNTDGSTKSQAEINFINDARNSSAFETIRLATDLTSVGIEINRFMNELKQDPSRQADYELFRKLFLPKYAHLVNKSIAAAEASLYKRNVIMPGTMLSMQCNSIVGVGLTSKLAIAKSIKSAVFNVLGESAMTDAHDGSAVRSPFLAILEQGSLGTNAGGYELEKTILRWYELHTGTPLLGKWAIFTITNALMRASRKSTYSLYGIFRKMHNLRWNHLYDLCNSVAMHSYLAGETSTRLKFKKNIVEKCPNGNLIYLNEGIHYLISNLFKYEGANAGKVEFPMYVTLEGVISSDNKVKYDTNHLIATNGFTYCITLFDNAGKAFRLRSKVVSQEGEEAEAALDELANTAAAYLSKTDQNKKPMYHTVDSVFELHEILGGINSEKYDKKSGFLYSEDSNYATAWMLNYVQKENPDYNGSAVDINQEHYNQPLKKTFVGYLADESGVKEGLFNLNGTEIWTDDKVELNTIEVDNRRHGKLQDPDHEADEGQVTEMSQVMASLDAGGETHAFAKLAFTDLGRLAAQGMQIETKLVDSIAKLQKSIELTNGNVSETERQEIASRIYDIIGRAFFDAYHARNDVDLAALIVNNVKEKFRKQIPEKHMEEAIKGFEDLLPASDSNIFSELVSSIASNITKKALKRKYHGLGCVMVPSFGRTQVFHFTENNEDRSLTYNDILRLATIPVFRDMDLLADKASFSMDHSRISGKTVVTYNADSNSYLVSTLPDALDWTPIEKLLLLQLIRRNMTQSNIINIAIDDYNALDPQIFYNLGFNVKETNTETNLVTLEKSLISENTLLDLFVRTYLEQELEKPKYTKEGVTWFLPTDDARITYSTAVVDELGNVTTREKVITRRLDTLLIYHEFEYYYDNERLQALVLKIFFNSDEYKLKYSHLFEDPRDAKKRMMSITRHPERAAIVNTFILEHWAEFAGAKCKGDALLYTNAKGEKQVLDGLNIAFPKKAGEPDLFYEDLAPALSFNKTYLEDITSPKDLRPQRLTFEVQGKRYNLFNLDAVVDAYLITKNALKRYVWKAPGEFAKYGKAYSTNERTVELQSAIQQAMRDLVDLGTAQISSVSLTPLHIDRNSLQNEAAELVISNTYKSIFNQGDKSLDLILHDFKEDAVNDTSVINADLILASHSDLINITFNTDLEALSKSTFGDESWVPLQYRNNIILKNDEDGRYYIYKRSGLELREQYQIGYLKERTDLAEDKDGIYYVSDNSHLPTNDPIYDDLEVRGDKIYQRVYFVQNFLHRQVNQRSVNYTYINKEAIAEMLETDSSNDKVSARVASIIQDIYKNSGMSWIQLNGLFKNDPKSYKFTRDVLSSSKFNYKKEEAFDYSIDGQLLLLDAILKNESLKGEEVLLLHNKDNKAMKALKFKDILKDIQKKRASLLKQIVELSRYVVAARIPAQSLQSYMKMKVVAFMETAKNECLVSHWQAWLQGSDYDIDKAYILGYEYRNNGSFYDWSPLFDYSSNKLALKSLELPTPKGFEINTTIRDVAPAANNLSSSLLLPNVQYDIIYMRHADELDSNDVEILRDKAKQVLNVNKALAKITSVDDLVEYILNTSKSGVLVSDIKFRTADGHSVVDTLVDALLTSSKINILRKHKVKGIPNTWELKIQELGTVAAEVAKVQSGITPETLNTFKISSANIESADLKHLHSIYGYVYHTVDGQRIPYTNAQLLKEVYGIDLSKNAYSLNEMIGKIKQFCLEESLKLDLDISDIKPIIVAGGEEIDLSSAEQISNLSKFEALIHDKNSFYSLDEIREYAALLDKTYIGSDNETHHSFRIEPDDTVKVFNPSRYFKYIIGLDGYIDRTTILIHNLENLIDILKSTKAKSSLELTYIDSSGLTNYFDDADGNHLLATKDNIASLISKYQRQINYLQSDLEKAKVSRLDAYKNVLNLMEEYEHDGVVDVVLDKDSSENTKIIDQLIQHLQHSIAPDDLEWTYKNSVAARVMQIVNDPRNIPLAYSPISLDYIGELAANSPKGKSSEGMTSMNPATKFVFLRLNMDGKNVISIAAVGEKVFMGLTYYYNEGIRNHGIDTRWADNMKFISRTTRIQGRASGNPEEVLKTSITDNSWYNLRGLSELDIELLKEAFYKYDGIEKNIAVTHPDWSKTLIRAEVEKCYKENANNMSHADLMISLLLSAATDNAKELILKKINAGENLAKVYLHLLIQGYNLSDIVAFMTSPAIELVSQMIEPNIFQLQRDPSIYTIQTFLTKNESNVAFLNAFFNNNADSGFSRFLTELKKTDPILAAYLIEAFKMDDTGITADKLLYNMTPELAKALLDYMYEAFESDSKLRSMDREIANDLYNNTLKLINCGTQIYYALLEDMKKLSTEDPSLAESFSVTRDYMRHPKLVNAYAATDPDKIIVAKHLLITRNLSILNMKKDIAEFVQIYEDANETSGLGTLMGMAKEVTTVYPDFISKLNSIQAIVNNSCNKDSTVLTGNGLYIPAILGIQEILLQDKKTAIETLKTKLGDTKFKDLARALSLKHGIYDCNGVNGNESSPDTTIGIIIEALYNGLIKLHPAKGGKSYNGKMDFDLIRFVEDEEYRNNAIQFYNLVKHQYNILDVMWRSPQYRQALKAWRNASKIINLSSAASTITTKLATIVSLDRNSKLQKHDINGILDYSRELLILNWLKSMDNPFKFPVVKGQKLYVKEGNFDQEVYDDTLGEMVPIDSCNAIRNFKIWFERTFIPGLKLGRLVLVGENGLEVNIDLGDSIKDNAFVKAIVTGTDNGKIIKKLNVLMDAASSNLLTAADFYRIQKGFNDLDLAIKLSDDDVASKFSIKDAIILYNILINKNAPGRDRMTAIFGSSVSDSDSILSGYFKYMASLDMLIKSMTPMELEHYLALLGYNESEVHFRLMRTYSSKARSHNGELYIKTRTPEGHTAILKRIGRGNKNASYGPVNSSDIFWLDTTLPESTINKRILHFDEDGIFYMPKADGQSTWLTILTESKVNDAQLVKDIFNRLMLQSKIGITLNC